MRKDPSIPHRERDGFSLVLSLAVMALLVLVVLSVAGLLALESRVAITSQALRQARLNALAAAREAIGVLQQEMGPDQRISAGATLLDANPDTLDLADGAVKSGVADGAWHPHWVGSWNSYRPGLRRDSEYDSVGKGTVPDAGKRLEYAPSYEKAGLIGQERTFRRWLVSTGYDDAWEAANAEARIATGLRTDNSAAASLTALRPAWTWNAAAASNAARLLGPGTLGSAAPATFAARVDAPLVTFPGAGAGETAGRFAWWASDNSLKASVGLAVRPAATNTWERVAAVFTPDRPVPEVPALAAGAAPLALQGAAPRTTTKDFAFFGFDATRAAGAVAFEDIGQAMVAPAAASDGAWRLFWLDYAANARGVLSNPLFGDLKTDLNLTLENPNRVNNVSKHIDIAAASSNINSGVTTDWYLYALLDTIAEARAYLFYFHRQAGDEAPNAAIASRYRPYRGTSWTDIWRWYQSYNRLDAAKPTFVTPVRPVPIPVSTHTGGYTPGHQYLDQYDLLDYPRFAKIQYVYAYTAQPYGTRPDGSPQYRLGISFVPVVTIWNPFNFRLELPVPTSRGGVSAGMKLGGVPVGFHVGFRRWDAPTGTYGSTNWVTPGSPNLPTQGQRWVHTSFFATQTWVSNFRVGKDGSPSRLWLDPGESVVFTPNLSGDYVKVSAGLDGFNSYPGYEPRFGIVNYGDSLGTSGGILGAVTPVSNWAWTGGADDRVVIQPYYSDHWANQAWGNRETALDFWTDNGWPVQEYRGHFITDFKAVVEGPSGQNTLKLNYNPAKFRSVRLAEALGQKIPFMAMSVYLKSEQGTSAAGRQYPNLAFLHSSLMSRSQTLDRDQVDLLWLRNVGVEFYIDQLFGSWDSDAVQLDINNRGFVGSGLTAENGATFWAGAEQPYWPMISMAQLQNAQMGSPALGAWRTQGTWNSGGAIDFAFGNSVGYVGIPVDAAINSGPTPSPWTTTQTGTRFLIDHAYLANWSGWDYYFCSSLTRQDTLGFGAHGVTRRDLAQVFDEFRRGVARLPNPRLTWIRNTGEADDAAAFARILQPSLVPYVAAGIPAGSSREGDMTQSDSQTKLARNLLQEGVFNVNSASKEAWRALLFASRDKAVAYDGTYEDYYVNRAGYPDITVPSAPKISVETFADGNARTPFPRFSMPLGPCADRTGREEDYWRGFRALTDAQVDALAEEIVKEVKRRGPFLSLAEFVNRRVAPRAAGPNDWFAKQAGRADSTPADTKPETRGALQAALDRTDVNARFNAAGRTYTKAQMTAGDPTLPGMANAYLPVDKLANYPVDDGGSVARAYGSNGFLMQADILNVIGSFLTVRGDTFTIRCLGEAPRGEARAVCEIMVQRLPEYIRHRPDDTTIVGDLPETNYGLLTHLTNKSLGRRFRVVSFRWLSPNEI